MDKNNDIQVNKVNKWDKDIAEESLWQVKKSVDTFLCGYSSMLSIEALDTVRTIYVYLDEALDHFNELEARHQKDTGMISEYEEENRDLKSELDIKKDECDDLISRVFKQDEEYTKLETEHKKLQETHELCMKAHLRLCDDCTKLATENDNLRQERDKCSYRLEKLGQALEERGIYCRWFEVSLEWHLSGGESFEELNRKIEELTHENLALKLKNYTNRTYGLTGKIEELEKENKELKDTLAKDREFGKNVGELIVESIREGCDKGVYKLHPYMKVEIHVEETNNMPTTFDRHAIPRIAVIFNNTQTEMERDTAQHECEELNERIDRLWRVNDELNRKIKELKKENKELKATLAVCAVDANTAKNLCNGMVSKVKRTRNNKEEK